MGNRPKNISIILLFAMLAVSTSPVVAELLNKNNQVDGTIIAFWRMFLQLLFCGVFLLSQDRVLLKLKRI